MGIVESESSFGGPVVLGTECIQSAFKLMRTTPGKVVWVQSVRHAYFLAEDGRVLNNQDTGFDYPHFSREEFEELTSNNKALILSSGDTAAEEIISFFNIDYRVSPTLYKR